MKIPSTLGLLFSILTLFSTGLAQANSKLLNTEVSASFEPVMEHAQTIIEQHGFKVAHIQKCDGGLHEMGYNTDSYKVIFFGRLDEVRGLTKTYPQLIPLFPFKLAIYAEGKVTKLSIVNPAGLAEGLQADAALTKQLQTWEKEFQAVLLDIGKLHPSKVASK